MSGEGGPRSIAPAPTQINQRPTLFATLTPMNAAACRAFNSTVNASIAEPDRFEHPRRFMKVDADPVPLDRLLEQRKAPPDASDRSTAGSEDERPNRSASEEVWAGTFCLSYDSPPADPRRGWVIGTGKWGSGHSKTGDVDLMLGWQAIGVRGNHAVINFSESIGYLRIQALHKKSVVLLNEKVIDKDDEPWALNEADMALRFGDSAYAFRVEQYLEKDRPSTLSAKHTYFADVLGVAQKPMPSMSLTPREKSLQLGDWVICTTIGLGGAGTIWAASRKNAPAEAVAIKQVIRRDLKTLSTAKKEVDSYQGVQLRTVNHRWREYLCEVKEAFFAPQCHTTRFIADSMFLVMTPLCRQDLKALLFLHAENHLDQETSIEIFLQVLKGVCCLHECRIIHRDLKPTNVGVVSVSPPRIVLLDVGSAIWLGDMTHLEIKDRTGCTVYYMAPEMTSGRYSYPVDVWAAGIVGYEIFHYGYPLPASKKNIWDTDKSVNTKRELEQTYSRHANFLAALESDPDNYVDSLLARMLDTDPAHRVTIQDTITQLSNISQPVNTRPTSQ